MRILKRADKLAESQPQFIDVLGGLGKIIGEIHLGIAQTAQLVDRKLEAVLILIEQSLDFEKVFLLEGAQRVLDVVPHFSFDLPATVAKRKRQVRLARLLRLDLFADDDEARGHYFIFESGTVGEEKLFHEDFGASRVSR